MRSKGVMERFFSGRLPVTCNHLINNNNLLVVIFSPARKATLSEEGAGDEKCCSSRNRRAAWLFEFPSGGGRKPN